MQWADRTLVFVILSVLLGIYANPDFLWFTLFIGLNLFQSAFTNWCPMMLVLRKVGCRTAAARGHRSLRRDRAASGQTLEDSVHLVDLLLLTRDDRLAQLSELRIVQRDFPAHQNRARMVRDHRPDELAVTNGRLLPDGHERSDAHDEGHADDEEVASDIAIHRPMTTSSMTTIGAAMRAAMETWLTFMYRSAKAFTIAYIRMYIARKDRPAMMPRRW